MNFVRRSSREKKVGKTLKGSRIIAKGSRMGKGCAAQRLEKKPDKKNGGSPKTTGERERLRGKFLFSVQRDRERVKGARKMGNLSGGKGSTNREFFSGPLQHRE